MPKKEENLETEIENTLNEENPQELSVEDNLKNEDIDEKLEDTENNNINPELTSNEGDSAEAEKPVTVKSLQFASFEETGQAQGEINKNLDILMDIKLQMTVELGRTELPIKKVLELTRGSIIELEKVAGEPVELYANGKLVAHGEVVVIEDNFGLRITSITEPEDRLKGL